MNPPRASARDHTVLHLLREVLDLDTSDERERLLLARCTDDPALAERVRAMLARIDARGDFEGTHQDADADALIGTQLGPFRIVDRVGRGGMGVVYRALREGADFAQEVAIKLVRRGIDFDDVRARFLRERRILARLDHPHLARFIDGGVAPGGRPWFALEFVRGEAITRWCDGRALDLRGRVRLFLDVCAAVQHAHTQLVVHRDLKPANILVDAEGSVRLLDFGVAGLLRGDEPATRITASGMQPAMTPEYAAPEQFGDGDDVGVAADVYSLGVILYELACGVLPVDVVRRSRAEVERAVREEPPQSLANAVTRPEDSRSRDGVAEGDPVAMRLAARTTSLRAYRHSVRGDFTRIVETALAKEPERRYATAQAFADDLQRWLAGSPVRVSGNGFVYRVGKFIRRNRVSVGIAAASALGLIAATAIAVQSALSERLQREEATAEVARSSAVRDYLTLMFRTATENRAAGALTADEVLKQGASDIFEHFRDQPRTGQTTALMLSELYAALGDPEGAAPLLERLLQWPGIESNPDILASARFSMATVEHHRGRDDEARVLLSAAQRYWSSRPERFLARLGASRTLQARLERLRGNTDAAIETLEQSIREFRALRGFPDEDVAAALVTLSITLAQAGRVDEALAQAEASVVEYAGLDRADTVEGLTALGNRAAIASMLGRDERALADMREVSAKLAVFGASEALAKADTQLGELLAKLGRYDEALPLLRASLEMAIRFGGPEGRLAAGVRQRLVQACLDAGRPEEAEPLVEEVLAQALRSSGNASRDTGIAYRQRAQLRAAQRREGAALADLRTAQGIFEAMGANGVSQLRKVEQLRSTLQTRAPGGTGSASPAR